LREQLALQGLRLDEHEKLKPRRNTLPSFGTISSQHMISLFMTLKTLVDSGLSVFEVIKKAEAVTDHLRLKNALLMVEDSLGLGYTLADAMRQQKKIFSDHQIGLIEAAEETGDLSGALGDIITYLTWSDSLSERMARTFRYPLIVFTMVALLSWVITTSIVPQILIYFGYNDLPMPLATSSLIGFASFLQAYGFIGVVGVLLGIVLLKILLHILPVLNYLVSALLFYLPFIGALVAEHDLARFSRVFSALLASGLSVRRSMVIAAKAMRNRYIQKSLEQANQTIEQGFSITSALSRSCMFPRYAVELIALGEQGGRLEQTFKMIAEDSDKRLRMMVDRIISYIEPSLMALIAALIIWLALAITAPLYQSLSLMG